jgi:hypothetical protein
MVSPLATTNRYILQPALIQKHQECRDWYSYLNHWTDELNFFKQVLSDHSTAHQNIHFKMQLDHFEHIFNYYRFEVIDHLREKLQEHESHLARMLRNHDEQDLIYYKEHQALMDALKSFQISFDELKVSFVQFVEGLKSPYALQNVDPE